MHHASFPVAVASAIIVAALAAAPTARQAPPPQIRSETQTTPQGVPAFRSRVTLVPLDVRVIDRDRRPVTDLTRDDFTILENGQRQAIAHFFVTNLTADAWHAPAATRPALRQAEGEALAPPRGRTFLLVVGRGRIQQPFDGIGSLIAFVRERLLPQDRVAVMAYNRITDFTTDHERVVAMLQRISDKHEMIEALLQQYQTGLAYTFAKCHGCIPPFLVPQVKDIFIWPGALVSRELPQALKETGDDLYTGRERRFADALLAEELAATSGQVTLAAEAASRNAALANAQSSTHYQSTRAAANQDFDKLLNGITEMRYFEGEKHIVFLAERGIPLESREEDQIIARAASDARIVLHTVVTGGVAGPNLVGVTSNPALRAPGPSIASVPVGAAAPVDLVPGMVMKNLATETGGTYSLARYPREALATIDEVTRVEYLIGYYPTTSTRDGKFRDVQVKVNRPDVTVLVRGGYYDEDAVIPADRAAFQAHQRLASVGNNRDVIDDLSVSLKVSQAKSPAKGAQSDVSVEMKIAAGRVGFEAAEGRHVGSIEFRIYCGDGGERIVGQLFGTMRLNLTEDTFKRYGRDGIPYTARVPVTAKPKWVKVIVYDPGADLSGSQVVRLK